MREDLLKFITCGSVDDGKSTLIGHMLYDAKLIFADQKKALELDSKVGSRNGDIDYSLLLDGLMAEREQGITIDVAYRYFTTDNRSFIVADTPGHEEYTRNMAVGASFASLAVILVDASKGVLTQTRRHSRICSLMGIRHFVFAVNKMDLVYYDQKTFDKIKKHIKILMAEFDYKSLQISRYLQQKAIISHINRNRCPGIRDSRCWIIWSRWMSVRKRKTEDFPCRCRESAVRISISAVSRDRYPPVRSRSEIRSLFCRAARLRR